MMNLTFAPRGILQIDGARIIFRNFKGEGSTYNREGDRNFAIVIETEEQYDALLKDLNKFGDCWNVKKKAPKEEGDEPFMYLSVKAKFNENGPAIYLVSGKARTKLTEHSIAILDDIDIASVSLDIRPYDAEVSGKTYRAAYLKAMEITQEVDRFADPSDMEDAINELEDDAE